MSTLELDKLTMEDRVVLAQSSGLLSIFEDPISFEIMDKAMMTPCGHSFSEETITNWIAKKNHCPLCNKPLKRTDITPNYALRNAIARFLTAQSHLQQNIQNAIGNVSVSSEWSTPTSPTADDWKTCNDQEEGLTSESKLLVEVISARDVRTDWFGHANPYCVIEYQDQKRKTAVIHRNKNPVWEEVFIFNVNGVQTDNITVTIWDKERILKDTFVGMVTVSMAEVVTTLKLRRWFLLQKKRPNSRKRVRGDILLRLQFLDLRANYEYGRNSRSFSSFSPLSSRTSSAVSVPAVSPHPPPSPIPYALSLPAPPPPPPRSPASESPARPPRIPPSPVQAPPSPYLAARESPLPRNSPVVVPRRPAIRIGGPLRQYAASPSPPGSMRYRNFSSSSNDVASASGSGSSGASSSGVARGYRLAGSSSAPIFRSDHEYNSDDSEDSNENADGAEVANGSRNDGSDDNVDDSNNSLNENDNNDNNENNNNNNDHDNDNNENDNEDRNNNNDNNNHDDNNANDNNGDNNNDNDGNHDANQDNAHDNDFRHDNDYDQHHYENNDDNNQHEYDNDNINNDNNGIGNYDNVDLGNNDHDNDNDNNYQQLVEYNGDENNEDNPINMNNEQIIDNNNENNAAVNDNGNNHGDDDSAAAALSQWALPPMPPTPPIRRHIHPEDELIPIIVLPPPLSESLLRDDDNVGDIDNSIDNSSDHQTDVSEFSPVKIDDDHANLPELFPEIHIDDGLRVVDVDSQGEEIGTGLPDFEPSESGEDAALSANQKSSFGGSNYDSLLAKYQFHFSGTMDDNEVARKMYEDLHTQQFQLQLKNYNPQESTTPSINNSNSNSNNNNNTTNNNTHIHNSLHTNNQSSSSSRLYELEEEEPEEELIREKRNRTNANAKNNTLNRTANNSPNHSPNNSLNNKPTLFSYTSPPSPSPTSSSASSSSSSFTSSSSAAATTSSASSSSSSITPTFNPASFAAIFNPPSSRSTTFSITPPPSSSISRSNASPSPSTPTPPSPSTPNHSRNNSNSNQTIPSSSSSSSSSSSTSHTRNNSNSNNANAIIKNNRVRPHIIDAQTVPEVPQIILPPQRNPSAAETRVVANEDSVRSLMEMGFERDLSEFALKTCNNDMELALDKLLTNTGQLQFELLRSLLFA